MSKKRKTNYQNYTYHVALVDTYDFDSKDVVVSRDFDSEEEAVAAAKKYAIDHNITSKASPFTKVQIVNSAGGAYSIRT